MNECMNEWMNEWHDMKWNQNQIKKMKHTESEKTEETRPKETKNMKWMKPNGKGDENENDMKWKWKWQWPRTWNEMKMIGKEMK